MSNKTICPGCQAVHEVETNFCGRCGTALGAAAGVAVTGRGATVPSMTAVPAAGGGGGAGGGGAGSTAPATQQVQVDPWIGRLIDGRYRVLAKLGHGGMGIVYKVEHQRMGKIAAMKVLHRELASDKEVVKRFRREAEAVSKLTHPNTVQTFDFGTADGAMYLVMEYVRGEDLGAILRRDGPLPFKRAAGIFIQMANALAEAHELGIVHRDLKPENVLVTRTKDGADHVKVLDFGLAKLSEHPEAAEVTGRGAIVGTPYYMSPEQIRGESLDHRSDIYSLGAMMYRIMTGEHPFTAQTPVGVLTKHLTDEVVPPRTRRPDLQIDPRVEAIVLRAMAKKREARYATIDSLREDLERAREELSASSQRLEAPRVAASPPAGTASLGDSAPRGTASVIGEPVGPAHTPVSFSGPSATSDRERRHTVEGSAVEPRLNRDDFEAFERSLRRRASFRLIIVPLLLVAIAAAVVVYLRWQKRQPRNEEIEGNNDTEHATLIALDKPVRGKIGKRLSDNTSDRDYYRVNLPRDGKLVVQVTAIRNIDLAIAVTDQVGQKIVLQADNVGIGQPETISNLAVQAGNVFVAVYESKGQGPTENVTDGYEVTVKLEQFLPDEEHEPNDSDSDARPLTFGHPGHGQLEWTHDEDHWRWDGPAGRYRVAVGGLTLTPVKLRVAEGAWQGGTVTTAELAPGTVIVVRRDDPDPKPGDRPVVAGGHERYTLTAEPAK